VGALLPLFIMFIATVLVEGLLIMLFNKTKPKSKIWLATVVMNVVSYVILFLFTGGL